MLDRVLRRDHHERCLERVRAGVDGHLSLLHRLEERRLRLRRCPVDLVAEDDVGEHATGAELERGRAAVEDVHAGDVGWEQVGGELDPPPRAVERERERLCQAGLAHAGHILDEQVPLGHHADQGEVDDVGLALDHSLDVLDDLAEKICEGRDRARRGSLAGHGVSVVSGPSASALRSTSAEPSWRPGW